MLENTKKTIHRIDNNYALAQSTYWMANCCINGYLVIYLTYRGFSDTQCGMTSSLCCFVAVILQFFLSDYMDKHMELPIKRVIITMCCISLLSAVCFGFLPIPVAGIIPCYILAHSTNNCNNGFLNAQMMQYNNVGIDSHYGWPRGVGSLVYALTSFVIGILIDHYSASILSYIYLGSILALVVAECFMPYPYQGIDLEKYKTAQGKKIEHTSYFEMLSGNRPLLVFLFCVIFFSVGQTGAFMFQIRIVEHLGGGTSEFGIAELIRAGAEVPALALAPLIYKKISIRTGIIAAMFFASVKTWLTMLAPSLGIVYVAAAMNFLVTGLYVYSNVVFTNSITKVTEKVRAQSLTILCYSFGSIIGNLSSGFLLDHMGLKPTFFLSGLSCLFAGTIMTFFCRPSGQK